MESATTYRKSVCPLDCPDTCGLTVSLRGGRITGLRGDRDHPVTRGVICRKMRDYHQRVYDEQRILYPLKRRGRKGDGRFERISWQEALAITAHQVEEVRHRYGGEAILPFVYAGNMGAVNRFAGYPLFNRIGASELEETICSAAAKAGWRSNCGDVPGTAPETAEEADLIVIWGSNTKVTNLHFWPHVAKARRRGARLVVVDPYRNITAASADLHLKVKPGEDAALALALLERLRRRGALDEGFIARATTGFERLAGLLESCDPAALVKACGLTDEEIEAAAQLLAGNKRTFIRIGIGMTRNSRAGSSVRAITSLAAALGLFDGGRGRGVLMMSGAFKGDPEPLVRSSLAASGRRRFNMLQLGNCLHTAEPPIKMLFVYNANPLTTTPDGSLVRQALEREDLFTVVHEQVMTPTARYADLLLPATTFLENRDIYTSYGHFQVAVSEPVIEPLGEAKSNFTFFQELAATLGYDDPPFKETLDERLQAYLESLEGLPEGVAAAGLGEGDYVRSDRGLPGTAQFSAEQPYRFVQEEDPLQPATAWPKPGGEFDDPDCLARYPLALITPPHMDLLNSTFGERYSGEPGEVLVHPHDARRFGVREGELITLYNSRGWTRRRARLSDATREGLLVAEGLFWQTPESPAAVNDLTSQTLTDMGGGGTFHESRVAILEAKQ